MRTSSSTRRLLASSAIGSIVEWYDFFVFASAAAVVFDRVFFPAADARNAILLSLATYAVGFITRPLGGLVFGLLGDRYGRKRALVWSLLLMGIATMAVGVIPGYASIGVAAPVLLVILRLIQGLAVGGEVGGALLLVTESLSAERRGFWAAWPMIGGPAGNLLASAVLALFGIWLGDAAFGGWGWRLAFLASGALIGVGVWMRTRVAESPLYEAYVARRAAHTSEPILPILVRHWTSIVTVLWIKIGENALFYLFTTFYVVYLTRTLHQSRTTALIVAGAGSVVDLIAIVAAGAWSDRIGRRPVTALGLVAAACWGFLLFPATAHATTATLIIAAAVGGLCHGIIVGGMSPWFVELFPTSARYTGFSIAYQVASVLSGAIAPIVGVALLTAYHSTFPVSIYAVAMTIPALAVVAMARETRGEDLALGD
ncbi:MAG TPA: MFS transporter [Gemmatimonadales bacterium]|nr:MFS transporter [Gemmatimonadales bacterium]